MHTFEFLANQFLEEAVRELIRQQALPLRPNRPHINVGDDYVGPPIMGLSTFKAFEQHLLANYPLKFSDTLQIQTREFPNNYIFNFLEAAVNFSYSTLKPDILDSRVVKKVTEELLAILDGDLVEIQALRLLSNITPTQPVLDFGTVRLLAVGTDTLERNSIAIREIPGASRILSQNRRFVYDPPHAWLTTSVKTSTEAIDSARSLISADLSQFQTALCLYKGATVNPHFEVTGAKSIFSPSPVRVDDFLIAPMGNIMKRSLEVDQDDIKPVNQIATWLSKLKSESKEVLATPIGIAISKFNGASSFSNGFERIIDLMTALEALLLGDNGNESIGLRLKTRAGLLLQTGNDPATTIAKDLYTLYSIRSILVHGSTLREQKLGGMLGKISSVAKQAEYAGRLGIQLDLAADRLRDLVRRALLMRLALNAATESPWTLYTDPNLDQLALDPMLVDTLNNSWRKILEEIGATNSIREAPAARLFLSE